MKHSGFDFAAVRRALVVDRIIPAWSAEKDGLIPNTTPETLAALTDLGFAIVDLRAKRTARSRNFETVQCLAINPEVATLPWHTLVQIAGLGRARLALNVKADRMDWFVQAHKTANRDCEGRILPGVVADVRWYEALENGQKRGWYGEYSSGSLSRGRISEKVRAYGCNPQLWVTASANHAAMVEEVIAEVYPALQHVRVLTVDWMGGAS